MEALAKAYRWSSFDSQLARKILIDRGIVTNEKILTDLKSERLEELRAVDPPQNV